MLDQVSALVEPGAIFLRPDPPVEPNAQLAEAIDPEWLGHVPPRLDRGSPKLIGDAFGWYPL